MFQNWFDNNLVVGAFPIKGNQQPDFSQFDYIINVSDEYYPEVDLELQSMGCKTFWFPMNEHGDNGINSIYGACFILYTAFKKDKQVYLHCHAGIHRSNVVKSCFYYMMTQIHLDHPYGGYLNPLYYDCSVNSLPAIDKMQKFLIDMKYNFDNLSDCLGGVLDDLKVHFSSKKI